MEVFALQLLSSGSVGITYRKLSLVNVRSTVRRASLLTALASSIAAFGASCSPTTIPARTNPSSVPGAVSTAPETTIAADPTEITLSEFQAIQHGMTLEQVQALVGSDGKLTNSFETKGYPEMNSASYQWFGGKFGNAIIGFQGTPLKVVSTVQFGLED